MPARLRLNLFSPLPPLRSEIANHTLHLLPPLGELAEVSVWTAQEDWAAVGAPGGRVRRYRADAPPWGELNDADATFYNLGNNTALHGDIFRVASALPGVVILHDTTLQHFFAGLALHHGWGAEYLDAMRREHGADGLEQGRRFLAHEVGAGADLVGEEAAPLLQPVRAVFAAHRVQVLRAPAVVQRQAGEEVLQRGVVQDDHAGQGAGDAEDVAVERGVVAEVVERRVRVVQLAPGRRVRPVAAHAPPRGAHRGPILLRGPHADLGQLSERGQEVERVVGDLRAQRRQGREEVEPQASRHDRAFSQPMPMPR